MPDPQGEGSEDCMKETIFSKKPIKEILTIAPKRIKVVFYDKDVVFDPAFAGECNFCRISIETNKFDYLSGQNCWCSNECYLKSIYEFGFKPGDKIKIKGEDCIFAYGATYGGQQAYFFSGNDYYKFLTELQQPKPSLHFMWAWLTNVKRRSDMNQIIIDAFPQTKDAVLIEKWFGSRLNDPLMAMLIKGKEQELLKEAKRLQDESETKK